MSDAERLKAIRQHYERIVRVNEELDQRLDDADERRDELREEVDRLKRRNEALKTSSLYVATVEELTDDGAIIKQHGNNQEVLTEISPKLESQLEAGDRVVPVEQPAVRREVFAVVVVGLLDFSIIECVLVDTKHESFFGHLLKIVFYSLFPHT
jgi:proteasome regulatory subunit